MKALFVLALVISYGCHSSRADQSACEQIFDRIVDIELEETGFRDPVLARLKKQELKTRHRSVVRACIGRPLPSHALDCLSKAKTTEELNHNCLR